ncbi:hypothetical protein [Hymenobacter sp. BT491]|nr:hypothetical protein [Hymenobacter sp. BT491]MBC6992516.1 hypothetical protein [Hymenobacter sp. BT491]
MKLTQQRLRDEDESQLKHVLTSDQYAKYQTQRASLQQNWRPGRRPPKR